MSPSRKALVLALVTALAAGGSALASVVTAGPATASDSRPRCATASLVVWPADGPGGGALGTHGVRLTVTNLSGHSCEISGTPQLVAVGLGGAQIGPAATPRTLEPMRKVRLRARDSATFKFTYGTAVNYPPGRCRPTMAAGVRVTLPGGSTSQVVPLPFETCSRAVKASFFIVGPIG
jgi:Protein of unknown function (DUF4232)